MFTKDSIGQRVITKHGNKGTVVKWDTKCKFNMGVQFDLTPNDIHWYYPSGTSCILNDSYELRLLPKKLGSHDARKIVSCIVKDILYFRRYHRNSEQHLMLEDLYWQAKELLGK